MSNATSEATQTFMLRKASQATECDICGNPFSRGETFAVLSGAISRKTGKVLDDIKFCGICSACFMPKPDNWDSFHEPPDMPTSRECLELVDAGQCDAGCILARDDGDDCECRCGGRYHGALRTSLENTDAHDRTETLD